MQRGLTYSKGDEVPFSSKRVLRSNNIDLESSKLDLTELKYLRDDFVIPEDKKVKKNSIFICMSNGSKQHVGKVAFIDENIDYAFGGFMGLIAPQDGVTPKYVFYSCLSPAYRLFLSSISNGIGITNLRFTDLANFTLPVPPIQEQEKIVAELDCLSGIIEKKKQQLAELDKLAQSIFYDMFGDPIINEKGWDVKKLGDVCETITDGTHFSPKSYETGEYKYITAKNIKKDGFDFKGLTYLPKEIHKEIYSRCSPVYGDVLFIKDGATTGIAMINTLYEEFSLLSSVALLRGGKFINNRYLRDYLNFPSTYKVVRDDMGGAAITRLTLKKIARIRIVVPPLDLQTAFAAKIEFIEHQKDLIMKSIAETETLFNSRMDYWFN